MLRLPRSYTVTCISVLFLHLEWTLWNFAVYCNIHRIVMYCCMMVLWSMYRDACRIVSPCQYPVLIKRWNCLLTKKQVISLIYHLLINFLLVFRIAPKCWKHVEMSFQCFKRLLMPQRNLLNNSLKDGSTCSQQKPRSLVHYTVGSQ